MRFRPCIDIHNGKVKQIVGSTLTGNLQTNFIAEQPPSFFAKIYQKDDLRGGHVIMLDNTPKTKKMALEVLQIFSKAFSIGGGITEKNAQEFLDAGAKKIIISSSVFDNGRFNVGNLKKLSELVGREKIVLDLSCRKKRNNEQAKYMVVTDKWKTFTDLEINKQTLKTLSDFVSEFLIHGVDQEGRCSGIEENLLGELAKYISVPTVYAGGIRNKTDIQKIFELGKGKIDFTIGSGLDLYGGKMSYKKLVQTLSYF